MRNRRLSLPALLIAGLALAADAAALEATLAWDRDTVLSLPVKGVVTRLAVQPGEIVAAGKLLVQLDQRPFRNRIDALEAKLTKLEAVLAEAKRELERAEELYDRTVLSEHERQVTKNAFIAARADYEAGRAELTAARLAREYSTLRAPFRLRVLDRFVETGQTVVADLQPTPVLRIAAADTLLAVAGLDAARAARLQTGQTLAVRVGETALEGTLVAITPDDAGGKAGYRIAVRIARTRPEWIAGLPAEITLP